MMVLIYIIDRPKDWFVYFESLKQIEHHKTLVTEPKAQVLEQALCNYQLHFSKTIPVYFVQRYIFVEYGDNIDGVKGLFNERTNSNEEERFKEKYFRKYRKKIPTIQLHFWREIIRFLDILMKQAPNLLKDGKIFCKVPGITRCYYFYHLLDFIWSRN